MKSLLLLAVLGLAAAPGFAADPPEVTAPSEAKPSSPRIRPKASGDSKASTGGNGELLSPDVDLIDTPTTAVLDYGGYSARSRFYRAGGLLQYISFGVFQGVNLGASVATDGLVGDSKVVRVREPAAQVKWRFYEGDRRFPSLAIGYDGQGWAYNQIDKKYNHRHRGFYFVGSQELGIPGFMVHPSINVSDFNTNGVFGAIPLSYNFRDKFSLILEWDNINNFFDSRLNTGVRVYVTSRFHVDFAVRSIGQAGSYPNGDPRGPERIVQLRYAGSF